MNELENITEKKTKNLAEQKYFGKDKKSRMFLQNLKLYESLEILLGMVYSWWIGLMMKKSN